MNTYAHDRKMENRRQDERTSKARIVERNMAAARKSIARDELLAAVKSDALKLAANNIAFKSRWNVEDITGMNYEEMTINQKIEVLENVIETYKELGSKLRNKYGDQVRGLDDLKCRIETAANEIAKLSIDAVDQVFIASDPDRVEDQPATNTGTRV